MNVYGVAIATSALIAGCSQHGVREKPVTLSVPSEVSRSEALVGKWRLLSFDGKTVDGNQLQLSITQKMIEARINCNIARITYEISPDDVMTPSTLTTEIGCAPPYEFDVPITRMLERPMKIQFISSTAFKLTSNHELLFRRTV